MKQEFPPKKKIHEQNNKSNSNRIAYIKYGKKFAFWHFWRLLKNRIK